jgi:ADP-heptose:LPS heptosyltransferase/glycosyltransferase involved in cell wall biosynthesis
MKKILIIQLSRLGDLLHSLPLVKRLKDEYRQAHISMACAREFSLIAESCPFLDRLIAIPVVDIVPLDTKEIRSLESFESSHIEPIFSIIEFHEEYDLVINLTHNLIGGLICSFVKSRKKSGRVDDGRGRSAVLGRWARYFFAMTLDRRQNLFNIVDIYLGMGEVPHRPVEGYFAVPPKAEEAALELLGTNGCSLGGRLIALQLGASNPNRVWPLDRFVSVANSLKRHPGIEIVLLGNASEQEIARRFLQSADLPAIDLVGKTDLTELVGVIKRCDLMIANDTGPLHLAAALGTRVLGLYFCSGHFAETAPYGAGNVVIQAEPPCSPCPEGEGCETLSCRDALSAEAVIDAAEMILFDKERPSFEYPNLSVYQSSFLANGTIIYSPLSRSISAQYQNGFITRRMFEAAFDLRHDSRFDRDFLPGFLSTDGSAKKIEQRRDNVVQMQGCFQEALKTAHAIVRESAAESTSRERIQPLIWQLQQQEGRIVASAPSIVKNLHALEMMDVDPHSPGGLFPQLIPKYSRLYGLTVALMPALEALSAELKGTDTQDHHGETTQHLPFSTSHSPQATNHYPPATNQRLSTAPPNEVTTDQPRHSGMVLAGIHKSFLDTGLKPAGMTKGDSDTHFCDTVLSDEILYLGLSSGENFGWGICGDYLTKEFSKRVKTVCLLHNTELQNNRRLPGRVFHTLTATDLSTLFPARGTHNFGYTFFENELMPRSLRNAKDYDLVFAGSTWCKEKLFEAGIQNVDVLVQGVDQEIFYPITEEKGQDRFVIFSGGKFELRKGQDLVLKAVKILQAKYPDIILVNAWYNKWPQTMEMMSLSPHIRYQLKGSSWLEIMEHLYLINGIDPGRVVTHPIVANQQLRSLYAQTDLGLFPNRCEGGTNLVLMEYMACGKPVVATCTSGHRDILTENNSLRLTHLHPFHLQDQAKRLIASWEEPSLEEILDAIEFAYHHRDEIRALGRQAGEDLKRFTWEEAAAKVLRAIFG